MRRGSAAAHETTRSVARVQLGSFLPFKAVLLSLCVLAITGCTTETSQVGSPVSSPRSSGVDEATHPGTGATRVGPTEEVPSIAQLKAWRSAVEEAAAGKVRGITWTDVDERNRRVDIRLAAIAWSA